MKTFFTNHTCNSVCKAIGIAANRDEVVILRFGSSPGGGSDGWSMFQDFLLNGSELEQCRDALGREGHKCELPGGALMFVRPDQAMGVKSAIANMTLHRYHVIV